MSDTKPRIELHTFEEAIGHIERGGPVQRVAQAVVAHAETRDSRRS